MLCEQVLRYKARSRDVSLLCLRDMGAQRCFKYNSLHGDDHRCARHRLSSLEKGIRRLDRLLNGGSSDQMVGRLYMLFRVLMSFPEVLWALFNTASWRVRAKKAWGSKAHSHWL
jgi:hypothetical protein